MVDEIDQYPQKVSYLVTVLSRMRTLIQYESNIAMPICVLYLFVLYSPNSS